MSERDEDEESLFNELSMNDFDSEEQYEPLDLELEGIGMGRVVRTPSNSISLSIDFENEGEGDVNMENILTSLELRRTNRHTFMCNWGMVICTLLPLVNANHSLRIKVLGSSCFNPGIELSRAETRNPDHDAKRIPSQVLPKVVNFYFIMIRFFN
jgi:hypothetical protein